MDLEFGRLNGAECAYAKAYMSDIENLLRSVTYTNGAWYLNKIQNVGQLDMAEALLIRGGYVYRNDKNELKGI